LTSDHLCVFCELSREKGIEQMRVYTGRVGGIICIQDASEAV